MSETKKFQSRRRQAGRAKRQSSNFEGGAFFRLCQLLLAAFLLYITASLFAIGVGELGQDVSSCILRYAGGGIILILLHFFYGLFCSLLRRQVYSVWSQWLGTFCLYAAISLFLGILQTTGMSANTRFLGIGLLSPGFFGSRCAALLPRYIGAVGTMLLGLCLVFLSAFNYGHLSAARVARFRERISALFARRSEYPPENAEGENLYGGDEDRQNVEPEQDESPRAEQPFATYTAENENHEISADEILDSSDKDVRADEENPRGTEDELSNLDGCAQAAKKTGFLAALSYLFGTPEPHETMPEPEDLENGGEENFAPRFDEQTQHGNTRPSYDANERQEFTDEFQNDNNFREDSEFVSVAESVACNGTEGAAQRTALLSAVREDLRGENLPAEHDPVENFRGSEGRNFAAENPPVASSVPLTKNPSVEIDPSGALHGTEDVEFIAGRQIPANSFPPPLDLLGPHQDIQEAICDEQAQENGQAVISSLADFGVSAELKRTIIGPTVVQYQIQLAPGIKVSKVSALGNDIAVALGVPAIRVEAPIQGTSYIGIELPNVNRRAVPLRQIIESDVFQKTKLNLPLPLGQTVDGRILLTGLEELPHLLIAGTTGSGKSIFVNNSIIAMCYHNSPADLRFIMVDPKRVEMGIYESLPHILAKPIVTATAAVHALAWAVREMDNRYELCSQMKVRNITSYNEKVLPKDRMPHIVIIVDELADLMMTAQKEVEDYIMRLAQMARAVGIHLMLATQRPSVNVLTGTIKANIPARVSFSLPSIADSRTILDASGAQNLLGRGDMLFVSTKHPHPLRIQSPFIDEQTNIRVVEYLRNTFGDPEYVDLDEQGNDKGGSNGDFLEDSRLEEAIKIVLNTGVASSSGLQRQMRVGFTRAARMIDTMEAMGIVGPQNGAKPREILVDEGEALEILEQYREG